MQLPEPLSEALEEEISKCSTLELRKAAELMTQRYREGRSSGALFEQEAVRLAYLVTRLPATYAAISRSLSECVRRLGPWEPQSLLDIGAGPGTGSWAAAELFPSLERVECIEKSEAMLRLGKKLACKAPWHCLQKAEWKASGGASADLALLSYLIGETPWKPLLEEVWPKAQIIVVIEPGTPAGTQRILAVRDWALNQGAALIAPCPHEKACPMKSPDWCHFPARIERTRLHKLLKSGSLGYEDEKFSYIAFGRKKPEGVVQRIVGPTQKASGLIRLPLCRDQGTLEEIGISRKEPQWKEARHAEWGDLWK